jgi:hypothetical protein
VNRSVAAAGLLTLAAAGTVGMVAREWVSPGQAPSSAEVCSAAADVLEATGDSLGDQVVLRSRAARLADVLIARSTQAQEDASLGQARRVVAVLEDPDATISDLARVAQPVAEACPDPRPAR